MTAPEVQFVLDAIDSNYGTPLADVPLERIDRDNSDILEQSIHDVSAELQDSNYVGATLADRSTTAIGTEYDHDIETVVGVRIEGAHHSEWGHVDPDGSDGVAWDTLVRTIRRAVLQEREFPSVSNRPNTTYTWIEERNFTDLSADYSDYYRADVDFVFQGFETLP